MIDGAIDGASESIHVFIGSPAAAVPGPLPLLLAPVAAVLDQVALQIRREGEASQPRTPLLLLPELLRNALTSLALALGFAALAVRPGAEVSLLREWQGAGLTGSGVCGSAAPRAGAAGRRRTSCSSAVARNGSDTQGCGGHPPDPWGGGPGVTVAMQADLGGAI